MARSGFVDERIVEMQFDNQQFEKNANQSIGTLEKLKQSLNLDGAAKGFDELDQKAKGIDFTPVQEGIAAIGDKFTMMGVLGFTAMQRISNSLIDMGTNLGRTLLGLDGISVGFDRYAEKSGHVKTIMTATGESIENVSEVLNDLNWFTDETSYAFTDMVNTMGKFTSAGVKLNTAKEAVEGIALWAAESGQNAQTASRAMFQLSQAYGRGTIQLQDWMSVEQANMSTQKIQNELIKEGGDAAKAAVDKYGGFRDSLRAGWLTTEVFNKVMQKYSEGVTEANYHNGEFTKGVTEMSEAAFKNAQEARTYKDAIEAVKEAVSTGWSQSFELMFGNAEESAVIWTDLANTLIGVADKFTAFRNDVLEVWNDIGGRDKMVDSAYKMFSGIGKIGDSIAGSFAKNLHIGKTLDELKDSEWATSAETKELIEEIEGLEEQITRFAGYEDSTALIADYRTRIDELMGSLQSMDRAHTLDNISASIQKFASNFQYFAQPFDRLNELQVKINGLRREQSELTREQLKSGMNEALEDQIQKLKEEQRELNAVVPIIEAFKSVWEAALSVVRVGKEIITGFIEGFKPIKDVLSTLVTPIVSFIGAIGRLITAFNNVLIKSGIIKDSMVGAGNTIATFLTPIVEKLVEWIEWLTEKVDHAAYSIENGMSPIPAIVETVKNALDGFFGFFSKAAEGFSFGSIFGKIKDAFSKFLEFISPVTDKIVSTAKILFDGLKEAISSLSLSDIISGIGVGSLATFFSPLDGIFKAVKSILEKFQKAKENPLGGIKGFFNDLKEGISGLMDTVQNTANVTALLEMAGSILVISLAISKLSSIPKENIAKALGAITEVFLELFAFLYLFTKINSEGSFDNFSKVGTGLLKISAGLYIIAKAITGIAELDPNGLKRSIQSLAAILLELVAYQKLTSDVKGFNSDGIIKMAAGLFIIVKALKPLAEMKVDELKKSIISMGAILLELGVFQAILNKTGGAKGAVGMGAGMILIATSMLIFAKALQSIGSINTDVINSGLGTMAAALTGVTAALFVLKDVPVLTIAAGFLLLSTSLAIITGLIALLGRAKLTTLAKGVGAIVATVWGLGLAMKAMAKSGAGGILASAAAMVIMAGALTLLTVPMVILGQMSWESIAKGLVAFGGALLIMGIAGVALAGLTPVLLALSGAMALFGVGLLAMGAGVTMISVALPAAVASIMGAITAFIVGLGAAISALALTLAGSAAAITASIVILGKAIIDAVVQLVPPLVNGVLFLIQALLESLATYGPGIITAFVDIIIALLGVIEIKLPELVEAGVNLAISFIAGIAQGIIDHTDEALEAMGMLVNSLVYFALSALQALVQEIPFIGDDIAGALEGVKNSVKEKVDSAEFEEAGKAGGDRLDKGLNSKKNDIRNTGISLGDEGVSGALDKLDDWGNAGTDSVDEMVRKMLSESSSVHDAGADLSTDGSKGVDSMLGEWQSSGNNTVDGLVGSLTSGWNLDRLFNSGASMAGSVNAGYNSALMINSPSKKMMWAAEMTVEGLVQGFNDFGSRAATSGTKLGEGVLDSISTTLSMIDDVMGEDDFSPVITPVLDLTNVEQGASQLDTLLASRRIAATASGFGAKYNDPTAAAASKSFTIQNLSVYGTENMDVNELSDAVIDKLNRQLASENSRWAY